VLNCEGLLEFNLQAAVSYCVVIHSFVAILHCVGRGGPALLTRNSKHFSVKMTSLSGTVNTITGDNCKCMDKRRGGQGHGSGSLPILHQAVTWSLTSPLYNDTIHLTGVYIFPDENQLQKFFRHSYASLKPFSPRTPHLRWRF